MIQVTLAGSIGWSGDFGIRQLGEITCRNNVLLRIKKIIR
jgi:hypothetical protein